MGIQGICCDANLMDSVQQLLFLKLQSTKLFSSERFSLGDFIATQNHFPCYVVHRLWCNSPNFTEGSDSRSTAPNLMEWSEKN